MRVVLEPRSRTIDPAMMMEQLFKLSELETRIPVNLNVLVDGVTPRVVSFGEALQQWLDHRRDVLKRRSAHRLAAIDRRLELLAGMIIVFLNLDEVIRIVREDDEPKAALMARFALTETQANYILDTRLRSLRRLEEMALRKEQKALTEEKGSIETLLASEKKQWQAVAYEIRDVRKKFGPDTKLGRRRTTFEIPPEIEVELAEALIEREPVTILISQKGWIRALKGHVADLAERDFQGRGRVADLVLRRDDVEDSGAHERRQGVHPRRGQAAGRARRRRADPADGRYRRDPPTSSPSGLTPRARKCWSRPTTGAASSSARTTCCRRRARAGRSMNVDAPSRVQLVTPAAGDHVATIGENRKLLVFPLNQVPEMARGKGVRLQRYKDGGISDACVFKLADGMSWRDSAGRTFTVAKADLKDWIGNARRGRPPAAQGLPQVEPLRRLRPPSERRRPVLPFGAGAGICP